MSVVVDSTPARGTPPPPCGVFCSVCIVQRFVAVGWRDGKKRERHNPESEINFFLGQVCGETPKLHRRSSSTRCNFAQNPESEIKFISSLGLVCGETPKLHRRSSSTRCNFAQNPESEIKFISSLGLVCGETPKLHRQNVVFRALWKKRFGHTPQAKKALNIYPTKRHFSGPCGRNVLGTPRKPKRP